MCRTHLTCVLTVASDFPKRSVDSESTHKRPQTFQRDIIDLMCQSAACAAKLRIGRPGNNPFCHHRALWLHARGERERIEPVHAAPGLPFDHGYYRIVRESTCEETRDREGPIATDEPRVTRSVSFMGPGWPLP